MLEDRIKALESQTSAAAADKAAYDARMDALMEHGDQMLTMMNEFKSIMDATATGVDVNDGAGPKRLPALPPHPSAAASASAATASTSATATAYKVVLGHKANP